jgi:hypothetical protein
MLWMATVALVRARRRVPQGRPARLNLGDLLAFAADAPHIYRTGPEATDVTVVIASPTTS